MARLDMHYRKSIFWMHWSDVAKIGGCFFITSSLLVFMLHFYLQDTASNRPPSNLAFEGLKAAVEEHSYLEAQLKDRLLKTKRQDPVQSLPVLVIACSRPEVRRTLDGLLKARSKMPGLPSSFFPITVSQGCDHAETRHQLDSYRNEISRLEFAAPPLKTMSKINRGYRSLTHHYKFAIDHMFLHENHSALIVVEDDLNIGVDFFEYFAATLPLLQMDSTLFCVSAWNDNGRPWLTNKEWNDRIYRTDFFPGLGWMLLREFWLEIRDNWPDIYWDEYLRKPHVRRKRSCLRPELGRTTTFGRIGMSNGQYFDKFLKDMHLNTVFYPFREANLNHLREPAYTNNWHHEIYIASRPVSIEELIDGKNLPALSQQQPLRITYTNQTSFVKLAKHFGIMDDVKSGVMRNAFRGVIPIYWKGHVLYLAPPATWQRYSEDWL